MKQSKLEKVIAFVQKKRAFTFKDFEKKFGAYPSTEFNYLRELVEAKYVAKPRSGIYYIDKKIPKNISTSKLYNLAYTKPTPIYRPSRLDGV